MNAWVRLGGAALGVILGMTVAKVLFLTPVEEVAFRLFWAHPTRFTMEQVIDSDTFVKSLLGALFGLIVGHAVAAALPPPRQETRERR